MSKHKDLETIRKIATGEINLQEEIKWALAGVMQVQENYDALMSEATELRSALDELRDLMDGVMLEGYVPDSFTNQPADRAIAKFDKFVEGRGK